MFFPGIAVLILSGQSFFQKPVGITYGNLDTNRISVEEFNAQTKLNYPKTFIIDSAEIIFSIPGEPGIRMVQYFPAFDSLKFNRYTNLLAPGAWVSFNVVFRKGSHAQKEHAGFGYIFYGFKKNMTVFTPSPSFQELKKIIGKKFINGRIYFAGANYPIIAIHNVTDTNSDALVKLFSRCGPGTIIVFEKVTCKNQKGIIEQVNQTLKLE